MPEQSIRFGIKNANGERATTWKCVIPKGVNKNDIYIMCRNLGGTLKTSLHESGNWHTAYIHNFYEKNVPGEHKNEKGRFVEKWNRPLNIADGVTLALRIITPSRSVNTQFDESKFKKMSWIPNAPVDKATEIYIIITKPRDEIAGWPGSRSMGTELIGSLNLDNGDTVWIVYSYVDIPELPSMKATPRYFAGKSIDDLKSNDLRALVFGDHDDGSRVLYDVSVSISKNN